MVLNRGIRIIHSVSICIIVRPKYGLIHLVCSAESWISCGLNERNRRGLPGKLRPDIHSRRGSAPSGALIGEVNIGRGWDIALTALN